MSERQILFKGRLVRAILGDRKTVTRRVVKPQPEVRGELHGVPMWYWSSPRYDNGDGVHYLHTEQEAAARLMRTACPYGVPGGRLWVRETLRRDEQGVWLYDADGRMLECDNAHEAEAMSWAFHKERDYCPSIHMPRWASRISLELETVRVERLNAITHTDAMAEGVRFRNGYWEGGTHPAKGTPKVFNCPVLAFRSLWDEINPARGRCWDANPWVWVLGFKRVDHA